MKQGETGQAETGRKVENRVIRYLESQGYQVIVGAQRQGKSGIMHTFDMIAEHDDGITTKKRPKLYLILPTRHMMPVLKTGC